MTNLEAIQEFDKFDMAEWLSNFMDCRVCPATHDCSPAQDCYSHLKDWLCSKYNASEDFVSQEAEEKGGRRNVRGALGSSY